MWFMAENYKGLYAQIIKNDFSNIQLILDSNITLSAVLLTSSLIFNAAIC